MQGGGVPGAWAPAWIAECISNFELCVEKGWVRGDEQERGATGQGSHLVARFAYSVS